MPDTKNVNQETPANLPVRDVDEGQTVNVATLRVGQRLVRGIYDDDGVLLLAAGITVTSDFLQLLRNRKIRYVQTFEAPPPIRSDEVDEKAIDRLERELLTPENATVKTRPLDAAHRPRLPFHELQDRAERGQQRHETAVGEIGEFCKRLESDGRVLDRDLYRIVSDFADMVSLDLDLIPTILSLRSSPDEYLFQHCVNVAAMSMNIAAQLGLRRERIVEVGLGGLLHDVGMMRVPLSIRLAERPLTEPEMNAVRRHPAYTLDYLQGIPSLPREVRFLGFQVHERADGSGYPRARNNQRIHAYAKIVSIADAYVAMTSERPYRAKLTPYEAAKTILYDCAAGRYESDFVRAFLDSIALFPVGSYVQLDDGRRAKVVRANPDFHTRPVIKPLNGNTNSPDGTIDLATTPDIKITRTLAAVA